MPVVLSAAGDVPGIKPTDSIAVVTGVTYFGFLIGPPFFGYMSDVLGAVRWALLMCACILSLVVVIPGSPPRNARCQEVGESSMAVIEKVDQEEEQKEGEMRGEMSPLHTTTSTC